MCAGSWRRILWAWSAAADRATGGTAGDRDPHVLQRRRRAAPPCGRTRCRRRSRQNCPPLPPLPPRPGGGRPSLTAPAGRAGAACSQLSAPSRPFPGNGAVVHGASTTRAALARRVPRSTCAPPAKGQGGDAVAAIQERATIIPAPPIVPTPTRRAPDRGRFAGAAGVGSGRRAAEADADVQRAEPVACDPGWPLRHAGSAGGRALGPRVA